MKTGLLINILFILADDLGWTALSCYGNKDVATPNLDRLASQGMRFTQAYADSQCSPTPRPGGRGNGLNHYEMLCCPPHPVDPLL